MKRNTKCYSKNVKYVRGSGFKDVTAYISQHKDLIAKPILSATGHVVGHAMEKGVEAIIDRLLANKKGKGLKKF